MPGEEIRKFIIVVCTVCGMIFGIITMYGFVESKFDEVWLIFFLFFMALGAFWGGCAGAIIGMVIAMIDGIILGLVILAIFAAMAYAIFWILTVGIPL